LSETKDLEVRPSGLTAQAVFDTLIQSFHLDTPALIKDPLAFLAAHLRAALPPQEEGDTYLIGSVAERIERAGRYLQESIQALDRQLEEVRDALRRAQYRDVIRLGTGFPARDLNKAQRQELMQVLCWAATGLLDNSPDEMDAYRAVVALGDAAAQPVLAPETRVLVARACLYLGSTLGELDRSEEAVAAYDLLLQRFGDAAEPALREHVDTKKPLYLFNVNRERSPRYLHFDR